MLNNGKKEKDNLLKVFCHSQDNKLKQKKPDVQTSARILGSRGVMRSDGLTSADGNTLPSAEEPGVQLFSEADVRCCRCPVQSQVSENYTSLLLKH